MNESSVRDKKILLGVTGGIAAYKVAELIRILKKGGAEVQVIMTPDARQFITPLTLGTLSENEVLLDVFPENQAGSWTRHISLGMWADLFVIAPASANSIAKLAHGLCDNMLTAAALAARCPILVCPAMDHDMYVHPATTKNLDLLRSHGYHVLDAEYGALASGLTGYGRLPEPDTIAAYIGEFLDKRNQLAGKDVLVTAGPTREPFDPVRFVSNGSTGTMGFALAADAAARGANVTLIAGPTHLPTPPNVTRIDVETAEAMHQAAMRTEQADLVLMAAAVSDYRPARTSDRKHKKTEGDLDVSFSRTPDILADLGRKKRPEQTLVGFALETHDGERNAREKLERKNLDWIVLNYANEEGAGFGTETNRVVLFHRDGQRVELPSSDKRLLANRILDHITGTTAAD